MHLEIHQMINDFVNMSLLYIVGECDTDTYISWNSVTSLKLSIHIWGHFTKEMGFMGFCLWWSNNGWIEYGIV